MTISAQDVARLKAAAKLPPCSFAEPPARSGAAMSEIGHRERDTARKRKRRLSQKAELRRMAKQLIDAQRRAHESWKRADTSAREVRKLWDRLAVPCACWWCRLLRAMWLSNGHTR